MNSIFDRKFKRNFDSLKYSRLNIPETSKFYHMPKELVKMRIMGTGLFLYYFYFYVVIDYVYLHDIQSYFGKKSYHQSENTSIKYLNKEERDLNKKVIKRKLNEDKVNYLFNFFNFKIKINN